MHRRSQFQITYRLPSTQRHQNIQSHSVSVLNSPSVRLNFARKVSIPDGDWFFLKSGYGNRSRGSRSWWGYYVHRCHQPGRLPSLPNPPAPGFPISGVCCTDLPGVDESFGNTHISLPPIPKRPWLHLQERPYPTSTQRNSKVARNSPIIALSHSLSNEQQYFLSVTLSLVSSISSGVWNQENNGYY